MNFIATAQHMHLTRTTDHAPRMEGKKWSTTPAAGCDELVSSVRRLE
jgi:hypothetical protein